MPGGIYAALTVTRKKKGKKNNGKEEDFLH